jgi:hypothetical protein
MPSFWTLALIEKKKVYPTYLVIPNHKNWKGKCYPIHHTYKKGQVYLKISMGGGTHNMPFL